MTCFRTRSDSSFDLGISKWRRHSRNYCLLSQKCFDLYLSSVVQIVGLQYFQNVERKTIYVYFTLLIKSSVEIHILLQRLALDKGQFF